ncbi:MAG: spiro-SPASM protein [Spirochaetales bacterium]
MTSFLDNLQEVEAVQVVGSSSDLEALRGLPEAWALVPVETVSEKALLAEIANANVSAETLHLVTFLDQPFVNRELASRMLTRHTSYHADYTFADGFPLGLAPELLTGRVIAHLLSLADDSRLGRTGLFPVVQRDINRIDVETELSHVDERLLRLELNVGTRRGLLICQRLSEGAPEGIDAWTEHAQQTLVRQRSLPSFVSIQVVEQEVHNTSYSPYRLLRDDPLAPGRVMAPDQFGAIIDELAAFAPEAVVHLSLWGEISQHPDPLGLIEKVLASQHLSVLVETSGVGWDTKQREQLFSINDSRFSLIVGLDTADASVYESLRGQGFETANRFVDEAVQTLGSRAYVQAVRCEATEPTLHAFYQTWKKKTENVVIQKYDHFCGRLPQRKIGDISPLKRFPCWHLQRDLHVMIDGRVPLCREDIDSSDALGNLVEEGIEKVWQRGMTRWTDHVAGKFEGICKECDEYYTFNF